MGIIQKEYNCFIISAFGTKPLIRNPDEVFDFDANQNEIKEAVKSYEGFHPDVRLKIRRADEFSGGVITKDIYEQLGNADLVIAEVSSLNLNVYYELGVRFALRRNATIMLALKGTPLPFDLHEVRIIFYEPGKLSERLAEFNRLIEDRLAGEMDSPVYAALRDIEVFPASGIEALRAQINLLQDIKEKKTYGLKITHPAEGAKVRDWFEVRGTFDTLPPKGAARLFNKSPAGFGYWSQDIVEIDAKTKTWKGRAHLGANPPEEGIIIIAVVGKAGSVLWDYYYKAGTETQNWPTIATLTDDIVECDHVKLLKPTDWLLL